MCRRSLTHTETKGKKKTNGLPVHLSSGYFFTPLGNYRLTFPSQLLIIILCVLLARAPYDLVPTVFRTKASHFVNERI